jgi:hypothetical protein
MDLSSFFRSLTDPRRAQGRRYSLESMLWMSFLSIASGYTSYRQIGNFCAIRKKFFMNYFDIKSVPSYVSFRTIFTILNNKVFLEKFKEQHLLSVESGDFIASDGQTLRGTVENSQSSSQDFCSLVSLYCQQTGFTVAMESYLNQKDHEGEVFRNLLDNLRNKGVIFTLDALHTQKKQ